MPKLIAFLQVSLYNMPASPAKRSDAHTLKIHNEMSRLIPAKMRPEGSLYVALISFLVLLVLCATMAHVGRTSAMYFPALIRKELLLLSPAQAKNIPSNKSN